MRGRSLAVTASFLVACAGSDPEPNAQANVVATADAAASEVPTSDVKPSASGREQPNRPVFEASARLQPGAPETAAGESAPTPRELAMASCEPSQPPAGYEDCEAIEVVDGPPCELECWRARPVPKVTDPCCEAPAHGAIFGKKGLLVEADACKHVDPSCAHTSNIKSVEAGFHFYSDSSPREVLLVQGGCEMRAMAHGYVPPGVAAWTGCAVAKRFRWNGTRFTLVP